MLPKPSPPINWQHVHQLLVNGFSERELRQLYTLVPAFLPLEPRISQKSSAEEMIAEIIAYTKQHALHEELLSWVQARNEKVYHLYEPYIGSLDTSFDAKHFKNRYPKLISILFAIIGLVVLMWMARRIPYFFAQLNVAEAPSPTLLACRIAHNPPPDFAEASVLIEGGDYVLGERMAENMASFQIDKYEVTNIEYQAFVDGGSAQQLPLSWSGESHYPAGKEYEPVTGVSWEDAQRYCEEMEGGRLPTADEWERTCRGTENYDYPWGNTNTSEGRANVKNACENEKKGLVVIGSYSPEGDSVEGVADLIGNADEWVLGRDGSQKTLRGGGFNDHMSCQEVVQILRPNTDYDESVGFRCVINE